MNTCMESIFRKLQIPLKYRPASNSKSLRLKTSAQTLSFSCDRHLVWGRNGFHEELLHEILSACNNSRYIDGDTSSLFKVPWRN